MAAPALNQSVSQSVPQPVAAFDADALHAFVGRMLGDLGALTNSVLTHIGDQLGFYKMLSAEGPMTADALATRARALPRLVREWLSAQAAQGYVAYDEASDTFSLSPSQNMVFADESSPVYMAGFFDIARGLFDDVPKLLNAFRTDGKLAWHEHNNCLFCGTRRIFQPAYNHHLLAEWLPALDGVVQKLERGASVADVGCGHGASTIIMAKAFPNSRFYGFDYHPHSVEAAREAARAEGLGDRISFEVSTAKALPARSYDLVCFFDCLHDMGDPIGAGRRVREALAPDGTWMVVEPFANDSLQDNLTPVGAVFYAASTLVCTPASLSQEVGLALGAQAGEAKLASVIREAGFGSVRRAAETPFNMVLEARP